MCSLDDKFLKMVPILHVKCILIWLIRGTKDSSYIFTFLILCDQSLAWRRMWKQIQREF